MSHKIDKICIVMILNSRFVKEEVCNTILLMSNETSIQLVKVHLGSVKNSLLNTTTPCTLYSEQIHVREYQKDYFGLKCILSYYVPVQTIVSPDDANCVTPLIYPTIDLDFLFGTIVSFDFLWSFYFLVFLNLHTTFL